MADDKYYLHQAIAQSVMDHGIETMFGLMGDANLFMVDHYVRACGGTFVPAAIEGSSVLMALAYSGVSGKIGVATVTHGPAFTNCMTALTEGARAQTSMVLLCGDTPVSVPYNPQNTDQRELAKATGSGFEQLRSPQTAAYDIAKAFYHAKVEKRPIVLNIPADFMWQEAEYEKVVYPVFDDPAYVPQGNDVDEAIGMIASAKRPIILAGRGAISARKNLIDLANRLEAPLATTLRANGLFGDQPANMGIFGTLSTPAAYETIALSDCVISFGASLHPFTTDRGKLMKGKRVVQVNNRIADISRNYHPDAALGADAALTAANIVSWLDEAEIAPSGFVGELDMAILNAHPAPDRDKSKSGYVDFIFALERLEKALPAERILVTDGGRFMTEVWCRVSAPDPVSFLVSTNFGSIGLGLQQAIGAGFAAPERPIVLFTGDGGFMMGGLNEFNTAVRMKQDLIVIVCNDSAYGAEHIQFLDRSMDPSLSEFDWPSFAAIADALGGQGVSVNSAEQLETAIQAIEKRKGPILIDLKVDPNDVPRMRM